MIINIQIQNRLAHLSISGRFDFKVHRNFKDAYTPLLDNAAVQEIELEMSKLNYMDSSALGMLILLNERAIAVKKTVTLLNASGSVAKLLEVANFGRIFTIRNTA